MSARISAPRQFGDQAFGNSKAWLLLAASFLMSLPPQAAATQSQSFAVTSPGLADGARLTRRNAARARDCGGEDISPALAWSHGPNGTSSYAIITYDVDGGKGLGSVHWVAYDIAPSILKLGEGAGSAPAGLFVAGTNSRGTRVYSGPCPPAGDRPHHYAFGVYALDLKPGMLPPGLTRDAFLQAVRAHVLAASSIVLRYSR